MTTSRTPSTRSSPLAPSTALLPDADAAGAVFTTTTPPQKHPGNGTLLSGTELVPPQLVTEIKRYGEGKRTAAMVGIRADESLHRLGTIVRWDQKPMWKGRRFTTGLGDDLFNVYPMYDWQTEDIWRFHARYPDLPHNTIYDLMHRAGVPLSKQRLCQPYGDDQRQGLWLFHLLEPETWTKVVARVNGANTGALYVQERGNVAGYGQVTLPAGHTWRSYTNLLLASLPAKIRDHYVRRFRSFIKGWAGRGYIEIPDEAPQVLESSQWVPSWRRMAKCILRNDYWCKSLGQAQPKSEAWMQFKAFRLARKEREAVAATGKSVVTIQSELFSAQEM